VWAEHNGNIFNTDRVHVFSGATDASILAITSPMAVMDGSFGWAVDGTGDINGDGLPDIIVSAPDEDQTDVNSFGRAYVVTTDGSGGVGEGEGGKPAEAGCAAGMGSNTVSSWWIIVLMCAANNVSQEIEMVETGKMEVPKHTVRFALRYPLPMGHPPYV